DALFEGLDLVKKLVEDLRRSGTESHREVEVKYVLPRLVDATVHLLGDRGPVFRDSAPGPTAGGDPFFEEDIEAHRRRIRTVPVPAEERKPMANTNPPDTTGPSQANSPEVKKASED